MSQLLLPGEEFLSEVREVFPNHEWDTRLRSIEFGYEVTSEYKLSKYESTRTPFDLNRTGSIYGLKSNDGSSLLILSSEEIESTDCQSMFYKFSALESVIFHNFNTNKCDNMYRMFFECENLKNINLQKLNTTNVKNFSRMFCGCTSLTRLDLSNLDIDGNQVECLDMLNQLPNLRILILGSEFIYSNSMNLQDPTVDYIPNTNGLWNNLETDISYSSRSLPQGYGEYYAIDINSINFDHSLVSFGVLRDMLTEVSINISNAISSIK